MTGAGVCGIIIPGRAVAGNWRSQWEGGVYKCMCGWDHCSILGGRLLILSLCSSGFQNLLRLNPPSLLMLFGCISISMASLMRRSMYPVFVESSLVSCNLMM